ncbi:MAG: ATP-binding cassette domain-containing protein, partial [Prosthecobacter sp.]|nr:ATP-binding cassette domain-containing protein [Prosthecobacter sp.]
MSKKLEKGQVVFEQAILEWKPAVATWVLSAENADTPVHVNGLLLPASGLPHTLSHKDQFKIGTLRAVFLLIPATPLMNGTACREVRLESRRLQIGRASGEDASYSGVDHWQLDPEDRNIAPLHVEVLPSSSGWTIHARSSKEAHLNGDPFLRHPLVPGDRFTISCYGFEFTGSSIICVDQLLGARVEGHDLSLTVPHDGSTRQIMRSVSIEVRSGEFLGILGGSGQGKSTLMQLLAGLLLPTQGHVLIDGEPIEKKLAAGSVVGFVPQDDIVHSDLTVREALTLTARLRLEAAPRDIEALVTGTLNKLGLEPHAAQPIRSLSGGQRKRVNIATELLCRPAVLFLDEPTSGLDPENEESVVSHLQKLRLTGHTVVCTTHSLHRAFLFDRIAFVHAGRLLFLGTQDEAREHFLEVRDAAGTDSSGTSGPSPSMRLERIYKLVSQTDSGEHWLEKFRSSSLHPFSQDACPPPRRVIENPPQHARPGFLSCLRVLAETQQRILLSDRRNWQTLLLQPLAIGLLAGWVGLHDAEFRCFACLIATLWFGCGNAAQAIVRELPIFRRERIAGLGMHPYILSKTFFLSLISWAQVLMLLAAQALPVLLFARDADPAHDVLPAAGSGLGLFSLAFLLSGVVGVQIGLAISSLARTTTQATLLVPLALIPQILFSGFVVTLPEMPPPARILSHAIPSASAQRLLDLSHVSAKRVPLMTDETEVPLFFWTDFAKDSAGRWEIQPGTNKERLKPNLTPGHHRPPTSSRRATAEARYREVDEFNTAWQNTLVIPDKVGTHQPSTHADAREYVTGRADLPSTLSAGDMHESLSKAWPWCLALLAWIS